MKTRLITAGIAAALAIALIVLGSFFSVIITISLSIVSVILCGEYLSASDLVAAFQAFQIPPPSDFEAAGGVDRLALQRGIGLLRVLGVLQQEKQHGAENEDQGAQ